MISPAIALLEAAGEWAGYGIAAISEELMTVMPATGGGASILGFTAFVFMEMAF